MKPVRAEPYRWRLSGGFIAHLLKATTQQHHRGLAPTIARLLPPAAVVFDVGAHAGQYTKLFARAASAGRVYAFEPGSYARAILRVVVWLRRLRNVTVLPAALGAECGVATLSVPVKKSGSFGFGLSHLGAPQERWPSVAQEVVAVITIDRVAAALALDRVDLIKADIEGWELSLLRGAVQMRFGQLDQQARAKSLQRVCRAGETLDAAFAFLAGLGYGAFELAPGGSLVPVATPRDGDFWFISGDDPAPGML